MNYEIKFYVENVLIDATTNPLRRQGKSPSLSAGQKNVDVLKLVSQKIASNVTWLIDNNLPPLMVHNSAERNFIKLDNVFAVNLAPDFILTLIKRFECGNV